MGFYRIEIPHWHPTPLNRLMKVHWRRRAALKSADFGLVKIYGLGIPPARGKRRVHLIITLTKGDKACDVDAYWKSCLDALVRARLLVDDDRHSVVLDPVEFRWDKKPGTTIELYDLE